MHTGGVGAGGRLTGVGGRVTGAGGLTVSRVVGRLVVVGQRESLEPGKQTTGGLGVVSCANGGKVGLTHFGSSEPGKHG